MLRKPMVIFIALALLTTTAWAREQEEVPAAEDQRLTFDFDMRASAGASYKMTGGHADWGMGMDLLALFRITPLGSGHSIMPELGYSSSIHHDHVRDHYFVAGVGYGYNSKWFAAGIIPSLVVGSTQGFHHGQNDGLGFRTTVFTEIPRIIGIQVHHQTVVFGGEMVNEFCFSASLNLGLIYVVMALGG